MAQEDLIPAKKGEIRNPYGKAKGTPNRSTIAKLVLNMKTEPPERVMENLRNLYPQYFAKKNNKWTAEFIGYLRQMQRVIMMGDTRAFELILDSAYGKAGDHGDTNIQVVIPILGKETITE